MISYLLINVILTCAALTINHFMNIPHRIRFYMMMTAVIAWLTPFALMTIEIPQPAVPFLPIQLTQLSEPLFNSQTISPFKFPTMMVLYTMFLIGLTWFFIDVISTLRHIQKLKQQSKPYKNQESIRVAQGISGAFISGYFKPIIWLNEQLTHTDTFSSIITHERQHIKSHDQFWLFIITLVQRLFWFNPLSLLLCHQCKKSIELSCDEACKNTLGQSQYQSHLAQLVIAQHHNTHVLMNNQIHQNKNFNIHRIEQLEKENTMTRTQKTKLSLIILTVLLMGAYSLTTVANTSGIPEIADNQILLELKIHRNDEEPAEITLITTKGEVAHLTYDNHDFGFTTQVMEEEPTQIYTDIKISRIDNGTKTEIANPGILTTNTQWGAFKFGDDDTYFDISIMAKTSSNMDPVAEAVDNFIEKNDPAPIWINDEE